MSSTRTVCRGVFALLRSGALALPIAAHTSKAIYEHGPSHYRRTEDLAVGVLDAPTLTANHSPVPRVPGAPFVGARTPDVAPAVELAASPTAVDLTSYVLGAISGCGGRQHPQYRQRPDGAEDELDKPCIDGHGFALICNDYRLLRVLIHFYHKQIRRGEHQAESMS
jgi:hypothetical protein